MEDVPVGAEVAGCCCCPLGAVGVEAAVAFGAADCELSARGLVGVSPE